MKRFIARPIPSDNRHSTASAARPAHPRSEATFPANSAKNMVGRIHPRRRASDSDAYPIELGTVGVDQRRQTAMTAGSSAMPDPELPGGEVDVVVDHDQIVHIPREIEAREGGATQVHVSVRLHESDGLARGASDAHAQVADRRAEADLPPGREISITMKPTLCRVLA